MQNLDIYRKVILGLNLRNWDRHSSYIYTTSEYSDWLFVVSQVDGEGYVQPEEFVKAVSDFYTEDSLKTLVKKLAPECITVANEKAKGKYKPQNI